MKVAALFAILPLVLAGKCKPARLNESVSVDPSQTHAGASITHAVQPPSTPMAEPTAESSADPTASPSEGPTATGSEPLAAESTGADGGGGEFPVDSNTPDPEGSGPFTGEGTFQDRAPADSQTTCMRPWPGATLDNPNHNPICNRSLKVSWGGKSAYARVRDRCQSCAMRDLDMSPSLFYALTGKLGYGRLGNPTINDSPPISWEWVEGEVPLTPLPKAEGGETYGLNYD